MSLNAKVHGDALVAGGTVTVHDTIVQDLLITGGTVLVSGPVNDDVRIAGGTVNLEGNVYGDVLVFGGNVSIGSNATVSGDLLLMGGSIVINGTVKGNVKVMGGTIRINGTIEGETEVSNTGELFINGHLLGKSKLSARTIELGDQAVFSQDVYYWNEKGNPDFKSKMSGAKAVSDPSLAMEEEEGFRGWPFWSFMLLYLVYGIIMITLLQKLFGEYFFRASDTLRKNTLRSFGAGVLYFISIPAIVILMCITIVGIPAGLFTLFLYLFSLLFSPVITALGIACYVVKPSSKSGRLILSAFLIFILLQIIGSIPVIGWIIGMIATSVVFGALLLSWLKSPDPNQSIASL